MDLMQKRSQDESLVNGSREKFAEEVQREIQRGGNKKNAETLDRTLTLVEKCEHKQISEQQLRAQIRRSIAKVVDAFKNSKHYLNLDLDYLKKHKPKYFKSLSQAKKNTIAIEKKALDLLLSHITENVMVAYGAHESAIGGKPAEKLKYMRDKTAEYGTLFLNSRPSVYDSAFSMGLFQFTPPAVTDVYDLGKQIGIEMPKQLDGYTSLDKHTDAAVLFAIINLKTLIRHAKNTRGGRNLADLAEMLRSKDYTNKDSFMAGVLGLMHNSPSNSRYILYFVESKKKGDMVANASTSSFSGGDIRKKYFIESAEIHKLLVMESVAVRKKGTASR